MELRHRDHPRRHDVVAPADDDPSQPTVESHPPVLETLKRSLVGAPLASSEIDEQRISKRVGLAVFSSDAISSTAYATEEILFVVALGASSLALGLPVLVPIALAVALLLLIVSAAYRQTIRSYPSGGGSYVVSRENLGETPSLVAGASLLVDYILTVAVSISAGVAAILSIPAFAGLRDHRVAVGLVLVALITLVNLRGVKESGRAFAIPTYVYIVTFGALVVVGLAKAELGLFGGLSPVDAEGFEGALNGGELGLFLVLKGFSSGAVALTGVEAISNGVPAFQKPAPRNAAVTLSWMAAILGTLFLGSAVLATAVMPVPSHDQTVIAQLGLAVFGSGPLFLVLQIATACILTMAANTAYADFPRLSSIIAGDGYLPRQLANRGDRLVFSNGIILLAAAASALLIGFGGITTALIPLYAVGVFTSFTLSQTGMVRHHLRLREAGWQRGVAINGVGAFTTFVVLLIVAITKFSSGAWLPLIVIPTVVMLFRGVSSHYQRVRSGLRLPDRIVLEPTAHTVVVLVGDVHRGTVEALRYAWSLHPTHLLAVTVVADDDAETAIRERWARVPGDIRLDVIRSPYRELTRPLLRYVDEVDDRWDGDIVTVLIPEFVVSRWWGHFLHNNSALLLKGRLLFRRGTVVTSVPYHLNA
ncbi:APC family permease [Euzebya pacifica]|uniref:APC family permease n=1 Tax=Euzebya pacifica TaxID=1608957 RepID=UPI0030F9AC28